MFKCSNAQFNGHATRKQSELKWISPLTYHETLDTIMLFSKDQELIGEALIYARVKTHTFAMRRIYSHQLSGLMGF